MNRINIFLLLCITLLQSVASSAQNAQSESVKRYNNSAQAQKARESLIRMGEPSFMEMISKLPIDRTLSAQKLYKKGHRWYKNNRLDELAYIFASAEKGYAPAQMEVARIFVTKYAKEKNFYDEEASKKWYSKAFEGFMKQVEEGDTKAMAEIGHIYRKGNSVVAKDIDQAEKYYRMGAEKGNNYCQLCLGKLLREKGQKEEALKWLILSAENGQLQSAFLVGQMYENGEGAPMDMTKAIEWYTKSANTENYYSREARNALKRIGQAVPAKKNRLTI